MVEQSTAAARSLADEANELTALVTRFATGDGAGHMSHAPARTVTPMHHAPMQHPSAPARIPQVQGNLAIKSAPVEEFDDWSEF